MKIRSSHANYRIYAVRRARFAGKEQDVIGEQLAEICGTEAADKYLADLLSRGQKAVKQCVGGVECAWLAR